MDKTIRIRTNIADKLEELKEKLNLSYSEVIEMLLRMTKQNSLEILNEKFRELEAIFSTYTYILELIRVKLTSEDITKELQNDVNDPIVRYMLGLEYIEHVR